MTEETEREMSQSELIRTSRAKEITQISELLRNNENVLITGKFVTGKTKLSQEILALAREGKVWNDKKVRAVYVWTDRFLEGDSEATEDVEEASETSPSLVVLDEVGHLHDHPELVEMFLQRVKELNEKGARVIATGWTDKKLVDSIKPLFPNVIDFQTPPETMRETDLRIYREANREYPED